MTAQETIATSRSRAFAAELELDTETPAGIVADRLEELGRAEDAEDCRDTNEYGEAAIEAFHAAHKDGQAIRVWSQHHVARAMGENTWGGEDWVRTLLTEDFESDGYHTGGWTEAEWDGESLDLTHNNGWRYSLSYRDDPSGGRDRVASQGSDGSFDWDGTDYGDALETLLLHFGSDDEALAEFGLASCEDYEWGGDGPVWLIADAEKFAATVKGCAALDEKYEDLDADDVISYLRDGTEPECE